MNHQSFSAVGAIIDAIGQMIYFFFHASYNDVTHLKQSLSPTRYCLVKSCINDRHYGAIEEAGYNDFISICSVNLLQQLEYINRKDFHQIIRHSTWETVAGDEEFLKD